MTTFAIDHPVKGRIEYTDKKRYFWPAAIVYSFLPLVAIAWYQWSGNPWTLLSPLFVGFVLFPLMDYMMGGDTTNPPEEIVPLLEEDKYYYYLLLASIPVQYIVVIASAYFLATTDLHWGFFIGFAVVVGMQSGVSINTAHEIGHKNTKSAQRWARIALGVCGYGHFTIEHNTGHHRDVSTPEDPASSRMGENIYAFMLREIPGTAKRGWNAEINRLKKRNKVIFSTDNRILQSYVITLFWQGGLVLLLGWQLILFFLIHNFYAWMQLTSANYIEHYGLLREKKENGKYELCKPHHSWNANHIFSNLMLFQLERHSDHHANPSRHYQSLRTFDDLPEFPSGYFGMYFLAYNPSLWFKVMDKRLMAIPHINGDLSKVNICPKKERQIREKWG